MNKMECAKDNIQANAKTEDLICYAANNHDTQWAEGRHKTANNSPRQQEMLKVNRRTRGDQDNQHKVMKQFLNN